MIMNKNDENLESLFDDFFDEQQSKSSANDVSAADKLFDDNPAPKPSAELIEQIKGRVEQKLSQQKNHRTTHHYLKIMAAAAAVILISFVVLQILSNKTEPPGKSKINEWVLDNSTESDIEFAVLAAEIDEIEEEIITMNLAENGIESESIDELEIELMEINDDFWKG
jgi:hypothetical protein